MTYLWQDQDPSDDDNKLEPWLAIVIVILAVYVLGQVVRSWLFY